MSDRDFENFSSVSKYASFIFIGKKLKTTLYLQIRLISFFKITIAEVEATQASMNGWTDKQNVLYAYTGILLHLGEERNPVIYYNVDGHWEHVKLNKPVTKRKYYMILPTWGI